MIKKPLGFKKRGFTWECLCDCGNITTASNWELRSRHKKSCGCEKRISKCKTHGLSQNPIYRIWQGMMSRCYKKNNKSYLRYGGRRISVCERWKDINNFFNDMGYPPKKMSIDRMDNNGNYELSNCKWATPIEQANNRKNNRILNLNGKCQSVMMWSRETGIQSNTISRRLILGWSIEEALTYAVR